MWGFHHFHHFKYNFFLIYSKAKLQIYTIWNWNVRTISSYYLLGIKKRYVFCFMRTFEVLHSSGRFYMRSSKMWVHEGFTSFCLQMMWTLMHKSIYEYTLHIYSSLLITYSKNRYLRFSLEQMPHKMKSMT